MAITRRSFPRSAYITLAMAVTLSLGACDHSPQSFKSPNMTALSSNLQPLFKKTKIVCFGHFTVEVPATAIVVYGPASLNAPIQYFPGESTKVGEHVAAQLVAVEKDREFFDEDEVAKFPLFGKTLDGAVPGQKLLFGSSAQVAYTIYSYVPVGKDLYVQRVSSAVSKDKSIESLNNIAKNLRSRAADEIPAESGTCIEGGFVSWQPVFEQVAVGVRLKEFPDVHFSIEVLKNQDHLPEQTDLESRLKGAEKDGGTWYSRVKFFRRGPRQLGDWKGSEALALKPAQENINESHEFRFISLGAPNAPLQPQLDIQLDTGASGHKMGKVKPSLTNEEAVALWDKLTSSIRVRPLGSKKSSAADSLKTPLASLVGTGATCSETGWWQCTEGGNIEGGKRRHFTAGEKMPHAVLLGEPKLWQKLTGERPRHTTSTVWQLVEYDEVAAAAAASSPVDQNVTLPNTRYRLNRIVIR